MFYENYNFSMENSLESNLILLYSELLQLMGIKAIEDKFEPIGMVLAKFSND